MSGILKLGGTTLGTENNGTIDLEFHSTSQDFTLKAVDAPIVGANYSTKDNLDSGQLAIYNGDTKLWGINESGWVQQPNTPAFLAYLSGDYTTVTNDSTQIIPFNATKNNNTLNYDTSTYRFNAPIDGLYYFTSTVSIAGGNATDDTMFWGLYKNNSIYIVCMDNWKYQTGSSGLEYVSTVAGIVECSAGDYVNIQYYNTIFTLNVKGSYSWFSGYLIG